jgi:hypothetical protein
VTRGAAQIGMRQEVVEIDLAPSDTHTLHKERTHIVASEGVVGITRNSCGEAIHTGRVTQLGILC